MVLRILGIAQSTYYGRQKLVRSNQEEAENCPSHRSKGRPVPGYSLTSAGERVADEQIKQWLLELLEGEEHVYGYKLLAQCIRDRYSLILNKKKAYRLCKELRILKKARERVQTHPRRLPKNRVVTGSNQLWQMDIKYGYVTGVERFFFVLSIIDVFDRVIVGQYRGPVCEAKHVVQTLWRALQSRVEFGEAMPESLDMIHERIPPRTPNMNAYIESFHSILEDNLFSRRVFMTFEEAYSALDMYMDFYNNRRMHGSLRRKPPAVFSEWVKT